MMRLVVAWIVWNSAWASLVGLALYLGLRLGGPADAVMWCLLATLVGLLFMIPLDRVQRQVLGDDDR